MLKIVKHSKTSIKNYKLPFMSYYIKCNYFDFNLLRIHGMYCFKYLLTLLLRPINKLTDTASNIQYYLKI